jgi:hypothetical protein
MSPNRACDYDLDESLRDSEGGREGERDREREGGRERKSGERKSLRDSERERIPLCIIRKNTE